MNAASIESSDRLNRVLELLSQGGEFTTLDIIKEANVCAVNSICLLYTSPSPRDRQKSRMPSSA